MAELQVAQVVDIKPSLAHEVRAAMVVWNRELIRFRRDPTRIISAMVQPLLSAAGAAWSAAFGLFAVFYGGALIRPRPRHEARPI